MEGRTDLSESDGYYQADPPCIPTGPAAGWPARRCRNPTGSAAGTRRYPGLWLQRVCDNKDFICWIFYRREATSTGNFVRSSVRCDSSLLSVFLSSRCLFKSDCAIVWLSLMVMVIVMYMLLKDIGYNGLI